MYVVAAMAPYLRSTVDGVLPARRLSSLQLAYYFTKKARITRDAAAAAGATSHHRERERATCACVRGGSTEWTEGPGGAARDAAPGAGMGGARAPPANDDVITAPRPPRPTAPPSRTPDAAAPARRSAAVGLTSIS